jgi:hypothetical protein
MTFQLEPDVAFGMHPDLGVAAAVADDRPFLDEVLRKNYFRYSELLDVYLLPGDTPHNTAMRVVARASREFQDSGLSVAADPRIMLPTPVPTPDDAPVREPLPGQSLPALTGELHTLRRSADVADVLEEILDEHHGTVHDLAEFVDTAAAWCERLDTPNGHELALHLRALAHHVAFLGDQLTEVQLDLSAMPDVTPLDAAPLTETPHRDRHEVPSATHSDRSRAALSSSPNRPAALPSPQERAVPGPAEPASPRLTR